ncbi:triosephosphate isomerase [Candidatus Woesearchaeota archaeon]|nr:triosephosphate isomerase [Candidatus Woesearchaeota archaeon]
MIRTPILIINLKTYASGTGKNAETLVEICEKTASGRTIIVAAQAADIHRAAKKAKKTSVFAQHIDAAEQGRNTGFVTAESVIEAGANGTIINHAEHKIPLMLVQKAVERARQNKLITVVCAATAKEAAEIAKACSPDYIAIEPPELISGKIGVSTAKPEIITDTIKAVHKVRKTPVICGAGVSSREDVKAAIRLGAKGVIVANFVMSAKDKKKAISELVEGLG